MTVVVELTPEMQTRLEQEAAKRDQAPGVYVQNALQLVLGLRPARDEAEVAFVAAWSAASRQTLQETWDNDEDAIYDHL